MTCIWDTAWVIWPCIDSWQCTTLLMVNICFSDDDLRNTVDIALCSDLSHILPSYYQGWSHEKDRSLYIWIRTEHRQGLFQIQTLGTITSYIEVWVLFQWDSKALFGIRNTYRRYWVGADHANVCQGLEGSKNQSNAWGNTCVGKDSSKRSFPQLDAWYHGRHHTLFYTSDICL